MISDKLLRGLTAGKKYLLYDSIYEYTLTKYKDAWRIASYGWPNNNFYIAEKDLESLKLEASIHNNDDGYYFYRDTYVDSGYTNRYRAHSSVGGLYLHGDFSFYGLSFYGEIKSEDTIKELIEFKKTFRLRFEDKEKRSKYKLR